MDRRFPISLVRLAVTLFFASIGGSVYLEARAGEWLARHPITVNLISAFICLNAAIVALDRVVTMFAKRDRAAELYAPFKLELRELKADHRPENIAYGSSVGHTDGTSHFGFLQRLDGEAAQRLKARFLEGVTRYVSAVTTLQQRHGISSDEVDSELRRIEEGVQILSDPARDARSDAQRYANLQTLLDRLEWAMSREFRRLAARDVAAELKSGASRI